MNYFIRFTDTIKEDLERNTSILTTNEKGDESNEIVTGLCAFGKYETIEIAHKKAKFFQSIIGFEVSSYSILKGVESLGKSGSLGTVVLEAEFVSEHKI